MELSAASVEVYVRLAFARMESVLDRLDDTTVNARPDGWGTNSVAGLIVHSCELSPWWFEMPGLGRDRPRSRETEFSTVESVTQLRERIARARDATCAALGEFDAGPTALDQPLRAFIPEGDRSDGALALHVLEELFQHVGHMEVTADAVESG